MLLGTDGVLLLSLFFQHVRVGIEPYFILLTMVCWHGLLCALIHTNCSAFVRHTGDARIQFYESWAESEEVRMVVPDRLAEQALRRMESRHVLAVTYGIVFLIYLIIATQADMYVQSFL